jgi:hypothetical protein
MLYPGTCRSGVALLAASGEAPQPSESESESIPKEPNFILEGKDVKPSSESIPSKGPAWFPDVKVSAEGSKEAFYFGLPLKSAPLPLPLAAGVLSSKSR